MVHRAMVFLAAVILTAAPLSLFAVGNSGTVRGTVTDSSGAVIPGATVTFSNGVSEFSRTATAAADGTFSFVNLPFNIYRLKVSAPGFTAAMQDVSVQSAVVMTVPVSLTVATASTTIHVSSGGDLTERDTTLHTDVDRSEIDKMTLTSQSSAVSSMVTQSTPGVSADSNGMIHGLGDHAENSFSVDGQPITDQQSKVFSNQIPAESIQSLEVISGAPPAEFGDKTSVVVKVTTRSGLNTPQPTGTLSTSYGSFGSSENSGDVVLGNKKYGNFASLSALDGGRFLDGPEFTVMHDKGNEENFFDRADYLANASDSYQFNFGYTRSWFQTPNAFENLNLGGVNLAGHPVPGPTDQRSQIKTFNVAPSWSHIITPVSVLTAGVYVRRDNYNYYPSNNPFADLGPPNLQQETLSQHRTLTNAGIRSDYTYTKGAHNFKAGITYQQTYLNELFSLGIVDPTLAVGNPVLTPYDLTHGGTYYNFNGHTDVKELALYAEDAITEGNWLFNLGIRGDIYNGLTVARQAEPRLGVSYNIKPTSTVLRLSYARTLETPFNENLILSSLGCEQPVLNDLLVCASPASTATPLSPGWRNEFHAGFQQGFSRYFVTSGEYIWKETHNAFDFSVLGATPITFPIEWHNAKIPGWALRGSMPDFHGLSALVVMSSVAARFFPPQIGGAGATVGQAGTPFRIDHDEKFNESTHLQYQIGKRGPWVGLDWRFDSGQVAGAAPCYGTSAYNDCPQTVMPGNPGYISGEQQVYMQDSLGRALTADEEFQAGFHCGSFYATPTMAIPGPGGVGICQASQLGSALIKVPAPGAENDDHNPPRIAPRNLFDASLGDDNLFKNSRYKWGARVSVVNLTNKYALYNFLSTFSGTHYVTPRDMTAQITLNF
jgi:hypothetical protein